MSGLDWFDLGFPHGLDADPVVAVLRLLGTRHRHGMLRQSHPVVFEVTSAGGHIDWQLGCVGTEQATLLAGLRAHLPGVRLDPAPRRERPALRSGVELRTETGLRPLRADLAGDTAIGVLHALQTVERSEAMVVQWIVGPWLARAAVKPVSGQNPPRTIWNLPDWGTPALDSEQIAQLRKKQTEILLGVTGRIAVAATTAAREHELVRRVVGAFQVVRAPGVGISTRYWIPSSWVPARLERLQRPTIAWPCVLAVNELAAVVGWPIGNPRLHGVNYQSARALPATDGSIVPTTAASTERVTGAVSYPGQHGLLHLTPDAGLRHLHVLGPTGVGKSTLIRTGFDVCSLGWFRQAAWA